MILIGDRRSLALDIETAHSAGARLRLACEVGAGIDQRTLQRWKAHTGLAKGDGRAQALSGLWEFFMGDEFKRLSSEFCRADYELIP